MATDDIFWCNKCKKLHWSIVGCDKKGIVMKKKATPEWMQQKTPLKNKEVYNALITMSAWVVDPILQTIYEYTQDLEKANYELINTVDLLKGQIEDLRNVIKKLKKRQYVQGEGKCNT